MQIKKVSKKVDLNVSSQGCKNDCRYYATWSAYAYRSLGAYSGCRLRIDSRWTRAW